MKRTHLYVSLVQAIFDRLRRWAGAGMCVLLVGSVGWGEPRAYAAGAAARVLETVQGECGRLQVLEFKDYPILLL